MPPIPQQTGAASAPPRAPAAGHVTWLIVAAVGVALAAGAIRQRQVAAAQAALFREHTARGLAALERGDGPRAVAELEEAHRANPSDFDTLMSLNRAYQSANGGFTPPRIPQLLTHYVKRHPRETRGLLELGIIQTESYSLLGYRSAEESLRRLIELEPQNQEAWNWLGVALLRAGEFEEARKALEHAFVLERRPQTGFWLACAQERLGDLEGAIKTTQSLIDIEPLPTLRFFIWRLMQRTGRSTASLPHRFRYTQRGYRHASKSPVQFTDIAASAGIRRTLNGRGSGWADYDGDGLLDLVVASSLRPLLLWKNEGAQFTDVSAASGLAATPTGWCTLWADYDNDGDSDLFVGRDGWAGPARNSLFRNDGEGRLTDVAAQAGLADPGRACFTAAWADYDRDGRLDLYVSNFLHSPNALFRQNPDGTFTDVAVKAGVAGRQSSIGCAWGDYDNDGDPDLYVVNLAAENNLYRNNGDGTFADVTRHAGVAMPVSSYAAFWLDFDNDGHLDLFCSGFAGFFQHALWLEDPLQIDFRRSSRLYRNRGDGVFEDVSERAGVAGNVGAMAASVGDIDNDGFEDLFLGCGGPEFGRFEMSLLFRNNTSGGFENISRVSGAGYTGKVHGVTFADYDNDGWQDLYLPAGAVHAGDAWPQALLHNGGGTKRWLVVRLRGVRCNREAIGARIRLQAGQHVVHREVNGGCGFGVTNQRDLHLGLGSETRVDRLEIRWPDGLRQIVKEIPSNQAIEIVQGEAGFKPLRRPRPAARPATIASRAG